MALNATTIVDAVVSHAKRLGVFEDVSTHEPKSAPGKGLYASVWVDRVDSATSSGLAATTGVLTLSVRLYAPMLMEPQDEIDLRLLEALDALFAEYSGDFELGGSVRCVDLLGQSGRAMSGRAGYLTQDKTVYRVFDITLPLIINDIWDMGA